VISRAVMRHDRRLLFVNGRLSVFAGVLAALTVVGSAAAHWDVIGAGSGSGPVATLASSTASGTPGGGTATLTWTAVAPPGSGGVVYYLRRDAGLPSGDCPTASAPAAVLGCTDAGLSTGPHTYTVTAAWRSWTSTSAPLTVTLTWGVVDHYVMTTGATTIGAGRDSTTAIRAVDVDGNTVTDYEGARCVTFSGPANSPNGTPPVYPAAGSCPADESSVWFSAGIALAHFTLYRAGSQTLNVADASGHTGGSGLALTVTPASIASFTVPTPGSQTAGVEFSVGVTARDAYGNTATGYVGTNCLAFSGPANSPNGTPPAYPAEDGCGPGQSSVVFTAGVANVPITLYNPASTVLTVTDAPSGADGSTGPFLVVAGAAAAFTITTPATVTAGTSFSVQLQVTDAYGTPITDYSGRLCVLFSGPGISPDGTAPDYPAPTGWCNPGESRVRFDNGVAPVTITLYDADPATFLSAAGDGMTGTSPAFAVGSGGVGQFELTSSASTIVAGSPDNLTIRATDAYGNTAAYSGQHLLTFSGASGVAGSPYVPTVSNSTGTQVAFGSDTAITFSDGVATVSGGTTNGVLRLYAAGTPTIHVQEGSITDGSGVTITVVTHAVMANAGSFHTCAVLSYGGVECWGDNQYGQLGDGTTTDRSTPVAVRGLQNVVSVNGGMYHTCALLADHTVWCWGRNNNGQLGDGTTTQRTTPVRVAGLSNVVSITAGRIHTCALLADQTVWCWGDNQYGELGDNSTTDRHSPVQVRGVGGAGNLTGATVVTAGMYHTCALFGNGTVACWGRNNYGQLGDGSTNDRHTPVMVNGLANATTVNAGMFHTCSVVGGGGIDCWGRNNRGQLGDGSTTNRSTPVGVSGISTATLVSGGMYHTCALLSNHAADCWGWNNNGQLGDGTTTQRATPVQVSGLTTAVGVSAGGGNGTNLEHSAALLSDGTVVCWGDNSNGQLGDGTTTDRYTPVTVQLQ
jgi:alpha-tubulin suppressor-like RCC1 family protein